MFSQWLSVLLGEEDKQSYSLAAMQFSLRLYLASNESLPYMTTEVKEQAV